MTDTTDQQAVTVALSKQLEVATDINACFCIGCGQPDEPELHDPARCPAREGGKLDVLTVADALEVYDTSCDEEPDLDGDARALHCAIVATRLASVSSASAEGEHGVERVAQAIYEAGGSFADQNGPIAWSDLEGSNDAENFRKMACAALAAMPTQIVAQDLREILERIRDVPDNLLPSATIQRMRNIAGFGLIGERIS